MGLRPLRNRAVNTAASRAHSCFQRHAPKLQATTPVALFIIPSSNSNRHWPESPLTVPLYDDFPLFPNTPDDQGPQFPDDSVNPSRSQWLDVPLGHRSGTVPGSQSLTPTTQDYTPSQPSLFSPLLLAATPATRGVSPLSQSLPLDGDQDHPGAIGTPDNVPRRRPPRRRLRAQTRLVACILRQMMEPCHETEFDFHT